MFFIVFHCFSLFFFVFLCFSLFFFVFSLFFFVFLCFSLFFHCFFIVFQPIYLKFTQELKRKIEKQWEICYSKQRLFLQNLELTRNNKSLATYSLGANTTVYVTTKPNMEVSGSQILLKIYETFNDLLPNFEDFLNTVRQGLSSGYIPKLTCDGTSGTYVLYSQSGQNTVFFY